LFREFQQIILWAFPVKSRDFPGIHLRKLEKSLDN
jgi:hypothetical protein